MRPHTPSLRRMRAFAAVANLCTREGLAPAETDAVVARALRGAGKPRGPTPLLRTFPMAVDQ